MEDLEITHREIHSEEPELLDENKQEEIIEEFKRDYESMVKKQNVGFIIYTSLVLFIALFISVKSGMPKSVVFLSISFFLALAAHFTKQKYVWYGCLGTWPVSIITSFFDTAKIDGTLLLLLHVLFVILLIYKYSTKKFTEELPSQISSLEKKKYSYKSL